VPLGNLDSAEARNETVNGRSFLTLSMNSNQTLMLVFKPVYNNVQVEAEVDLSSFDGKASLVHRIFGRKPIPMKRQKH